MHELIGEYQLAASLSLIVVIYLCRLVIVHQLQKQPTDEEKIPQRWINSVKNASNAFIVIGLIIIWLTELRYAALSIAAFTVALVIATREIIQCLVGSLYLASSRSFVVGDWIKIGAHSGEVVASDWLSTTLLEVDLESQSYGYTGRTLNVPKNQFITHSFQNLNFMRRYVAHSFSITREEEGINILDVKKHILDKAKHYCEPFEEVATRYNALIEKRLGVGITGPDPSLRLSTTGAGKNVFSVTIFCPTDEAVTIEQKLTEDFFRYWYQAIDNHRRDNKNYKPKKSRNED